MGGGLSLPFDQQVTLSPRKLSPNIRYGGVSTLAQNTSSFQEVSPPRQRHLNIKRYYLLTIQVENETIAVRSLLYIHNSKNPKFQLWVGGLSLPFDQQVTLHPKNLNPNFGWGLSLPFDQQVTLSPRKLSPNIRYGSVSTLAQNTSSFQEVSPPRQRHLVLMRCYLLTIQVGNERIAVRSLLYIHNSKKN